MPTHWDKLKVVDHMQRVIEAHLHEPLTLARLTRDTGYSLFHAARMFKEITGKTPFEYLRARRLSAAAERLVGTQQRVIDVAFDFVFDSHEGFTRAFSKQFGMAPSEYVRAGHGVKLFCPPSARDFFQLPPDGGSMSQGESSAKVQTVFVQLVERPQRKLLLKRGKAAKHYFEYCEEVGCEVWEQLVAIPEALHEPMGLWMPEAMRPSGSSTYVQGVELASDWKGKVPEGFECIELAPCKLLVFQGEPYDDKDFETAIAALWEVISKYRPESIGYRWADEDGPRFQLEPQGARGYIEGRPVRPL
ncbi:MAG: AraC family transcriptional regulator [Myxococcota bacterium]|nr:AraC family transcriptional regulator [Myxococcota bacterium]